MSNFHILGKSHTYVLHYFAHWFSLVAQSCLTLCDPMNRNSQASLSITTPGVYSNSCPSSR